MLEIDFSNNVTYPMNIFFNLNDLLGGITRVVLLRLFGDGGNNPQALLSCAIPKQDNLVNSGI